MTIEIFQTILIACFITTFILGVVVFKTNFCTMGAVSDLVNIGDTGRMRSWFFAIATAILGVAILLYILWGPILEASQKNSELRKFKTVALFDGEIIDLYTQEKVENRHEQANKLGELELVENRRTWLFIDIGDEDGFLTQLKFPFEKKHQIIRKGANIRCLAFSQDINFSSIITTSDAWLPRERLWVGAYPFLLRPAFQELCFYRLKY